MPGLFLRFLLGGCLTTISWGCTEERAEIFNSSLVAAVNGAIGASSVRTVGNCTAADDPALEPCQGLPLFPLQLQSSKDRWEATVQFATGLDTLGVKNVSLRCNVTSAAWVVEFDAMVQNLGVQLTAFVELSGWLWSDAPRLEKTKLLRAPGFSAHVVARVSCVDGTSLRLQLDPAEDSLNLSKMELGFSFLSIDLSPYLVSALRRPLLKGYTFTPPAAWGPVMKEVCAVTAPERKASPGSAPAESPTAFLVV